MKKLRSSIYIILFMGLLFSCGQRSKLDHITTQTVDNDNNYLYSFFVAGHTYGKPNVDNKGLHPPFKKKFEYLQSRLEIEFGVLTGDIVVESSIQDWDDVDKDIDTLGLPVYFAPGNHDLKDRALYSSRYGSPYYSFIKHKDLFIFLDPTKKRWNIKGAQWEFLRNVVDTSYKRVNNIFVFVHQVLWWEEDNIYANVRPNYTKWKAKKTNFWTEVEPLFHQLPNKVIFFAGDMGANRKCDDFMYDSYDNIEFVGSGMGEGKGDNFVIVNVLKNKSVKLELICLQDSNLHCFGDIYKYRVRNKQVDK